MSERVFPWWKWVFVALLGLFLWQFIMNNSVISINLLSALGLLESTAAWFPAITAIVAVLIALPGFALLYRWPGGGLARIGITTENWRRDAAIGLGVGVVQAALSLLVIIPLLGDAAQEMLASVSSLYESPQTIIASIVLVVLYGGLVEELFFRGHVITSLSNALGGQKWAIAASVVVSAALFAVAHDYQGTIGMVYALFATAIWAVLFVWTRRLTASIVAHASYDLFTMLGILVFYRNMVIPG